MHNKLQAATVTIGTNGCHLTEIVIEGLSSPRFNAAKYEAYPTMDDDGDLVTLYVAELASGFVNFFLHNPKNERGFGGSVLTITLTTGEVRQVRGPWSSRASIVNMMTDKRVREVVLKDANGFRSHTAMTLQAMMDLGVDFIEQTDADGEIRLEPLA